MLESYVHLVSTRSFGQRSLPDAAPIDASSLSASGGPLASYQSLEASVWGNIPMLHGAVYVEASYAKVLGGLPNSHVMLDEFQRLVVGPDGYLLGRVGYQYAFTPKFYAGLFADIGTAFGRDHATTVRMGPGAWVRLGDHSDIVLVVLEPLVSPDHLGLWTGMTALAALRIFVATGDSWRFP